MPSASWRAACSASTGPKRGRPGDELGLSRLGVLGFDQCRHAIIVPNRDTASQSISELIQYEIWTSARERLGYVDAVPDYGKFCPVSMGAEVDRRPLDAADPA